MKKIIILLTLITASFFVNQSCSAATEDNKTTTTLRTMYPEIEPNITGFLQVDSEHSIYWEESGNPQGMPIVFLHGGPGGGSEPFHRRFFDPSFYRIIVFDQRGCGKSKPFSSLNNNTTWDLVADMEKIRKDRNIDSWYVFGGSWGSTLALAYAIKHPEPVKGLILRGIYLGRRFETDWFYQKGVNMMFPDLWENFVAPVPVDERNDFVKAYYKLLQSDDPAVRKQAAIAWSAWEGATAKLLFDPHLYADFTEENNADAMARIECHYFINDCFFTPETWILDNIDKIANIPGIIIQGRYDMPCPVVSAWELHKAWPIAKLEIIQGSGHSAKEVGILDGLIRATDYFRDLNLTNSQ